MFSEERYRQTPAKLYEKKKNKQKQKQNQSYHDVSLSITETSSKLSSRMMSS